MGWPKRTVAYLYSDKEYMYQVSTKIHMKEGPARDLFLHALAELTVWLDVNEDGTYRIVMVRDGEQTLVPVPGTEGS